MDLYNRSRSGGAIGDGFKQFRQNDGDRGRVVGPLMRFCERIGCKKVKWKENDPLGSGREALNLWIRQILGNYLKVLDPPLYSENHYYLQQISLMGKKLRNREVFSETDLENDHEEHPTDAYPTIKSASIRKNLKQRLSLEKHSRGIKINNFTRRLDNRQIAPIITAARFQCPICLELLISPVIMGCGHAFCFRCLESNAAYSEKCCLCRTEHRGQPSLPLKFAETLIEKFLVPYGPELIRYLCRSTDSAEWVKRRQIANFKLGLVVDFQDRCNIWRRGVIVNVLNSHQIQIKINIKGMNLFEKVDRNSKRLAPYTFFTRSRYLEDFPPTLPEHDPTQNSLSKLEYADNWQNDSSFVFPSEGVQPVEGGYEWEEFQDEALRIFNSEMNQIDSILNI